MSYASKRNIVSIAAWFVLVAAYVVYATGTAAPAAEDLKAWAIAILVFIGIGLGVQIVVQIAYHIALTIGIAVKKEIKTGAKNSGETAERIVKAEMVEDEWSKIIGLKANRVGSWFGGLGVFSALIALAVGLETAITLHILFGMTALSSVVEGIASILYRERGVKQ